MSRLEKLHRRELAWTISQEIDDCYSRVQFDTEFDRVASAPVKFSGIIAKSIACADRLLREGWAKK